MATKKRDPLPEEFVKKYPRLAQIAELSGPEVWSEIQDIFLRVVRAEKIEEDITRLMGAYQEICALAQAKEKEKEEKKRSERGSVLRPKAVAEKSHVETGPSSSATPELLEPPPEPVVIEPREVRILKAKIFLLKSGGPKSSDWSDAVEHLASCFELSKTMALDLWKSTQDRCRPGFLSDVARDLDVMKRVALFEELAVIYGVAPALLNREFEAASGG